ncbi:MAG: alpha/beta hydrolase [Bacteroidetes bacterium]|jgi:pimeloyl-ACP methyl ester carboxylesterase|nr:alpha/beta hydrolase [Bacteroidota bacterium]
MRLHALPLLLAVVLVHYAPTPAYAQDAPADDPPPHEAFVGTWEGTLEVGGQSIRLIFDIQEEAGALTGMTYSPDQSPTGTPISSIEVTDERIVLEIAQIGGRFEGTLADDQAALIGELSQRGMMLPLTLERTDPAAVLAGPARPQHPEPPYPYAVREVTFVNQTDRLTLAGTLTLPDADGPHPAVVLIGGSGPLDRDAEVFGHKLFLVLADHLTRRGIAVLRYDERGVGASEGTAWPAVSSEAFARDAAAGVRFLQVHPEISADAIGLTGHSEGGLVAPLVHTEHTPVAFIGLLAAPSVPGDKLLEEQLAAIVAAQGLPDAMVASTRTSQRALLEAAKRASTADTARAELRTVLSAQGMSEAQVQAQIEQLTSPWFSFFLTHDPQPALTQLDVPVLALYGSIDLQVPPAQNAGPMQAALDASPSSDATVAVMDSLNHLFQPATTGLPGEYAQIETTLAPAMLERLTKWICAQAGLAE